MHISKELIEQAKACKTPEKLLALAKENGIEMTKEQAKDYLAKLNPGNGAIIDDELDNVSGGGCDGQPPVMCPKCYSDRFWQMSSTDPETGKQCKVWSCVVCGYVENSN